MQTKIEQIAQKSPEMPKELEENKGSSPAWYTATSMGVYEKPPENPPSPLDIYGDTMRTYGRLWQDLAAKDELPTSNIDLLVDVIKPTRKHRLRLLKGLGAPERAMLINNSVYVVELLKDLLQMDRDFRRDESENKEFGK